MNSKWAASGSGGRIAGLYSYRVSAVNQYGKSKASVAAADLDNDQDTDIVIAFYQSDMLIWFRNTDGAGNFELAQIVASDRDGAFGISVGDVDNDNDMDEISQMPL